MTGLRSKEYCADTIIMVLIDRKNNGRRMDDRYGNSYVCKRLIYQNIACMSCIHQSIVKYKRDRILSTFEVVIISYILMWIKHFGAIL